MGQERCFICGVQIEHDDEVERFADAGKALVVHVACMPVFQSLLLRVLGTMKSPETRLSRPSSFVDFLREKKPRNEDEILACLAYHLEREAGKRLDLTVDDVKEPLESAGIRMYDIATAFIRARNRKGYFERTSGTQRPVRHRLTRKGAEFVESLPAEEKAKKQ